MELDDVYPNDTTYWMPQEPQSQVVERDKEKAKTLEAVDELRSIVKHFDERIADRDKLSSIKVDITKDATLHQKICEVNDLLKMALIEERDLLKELLEIHNKTG